MRAAESLYSTVNLDMFVEVCPLCKAKAAIWEGTCVGSLVGVNSEVVKEVVPLAEVLAAVFVITLKDLDEPFRFGVLK